MKALQWEITGIIFIFFVGSFLHSAFELSGGVTLMAIIGAVNESLWEHLKMGFWPVVFLALIEYPFLKNNPNFMVAKTVSMYVIPFSIVILFYAYTAILGYNTIAMDVFIFIVAVILGQVASYKILMWSELPSTLTWVALAAAVVLAIIFAVFTFYPPHLSIFRDSITGGYGIADAITILG